MITDRETAEVIRSWLKKEAELNDAGLHRVIARLADMPQRRHRWLWPLDRRPLGPGATSCVDPRWATPPGRYAGMFTATRIVAAAAIVALSGTLALSIRYFEQSESQPPGAESVAAGEELDAYMLQALNETRWSTTRDLVEKAFTEDATFNMVWGPDDIELDGSRALILRRFSDSMRASRTEPLLSLPASEGEQRFVGIYDFLFPGTAAGGRSWPGTVCSAWLRDASIYRLDCIFPASVEVPQATVEE